MFFPGKTFQPSLMFVGRLRPANNRLGWEGLTWTNTLAFYGQSQIMDVKSFKTLAPERSVSRDECTSLFIFKSFIIQAHEANAINNLWL